MLRCERERTRGLRRRRGLRIAPRWADASGMRVASAAMKATNRMSVGLGRRRELEGDAVIVVLLFGGGEIEIRQSDLARVTGR